MAKLGGDGGEGGAAANVADVFFDLFGAAEFEKALAAHFARIDAGADLLVFQQVAIGEKLGVEVAVEFVLAG